jgi:hypothetical protein
MDEIEAIVRKYDEEYIRTGLMSADGVRSFAVVFYRDTAEILDVLTRSRNVERNPTGFSLDDAPILGLLVRMWKLLKEIVRYYREDNAEMISVFDRLFLEAAVTAEYLMRGDLSLIEDYRKCSYRHRLRLLEEHNAGSPFFDTKAGKRLFASITAKLEAEQFTEADFDLQRKHQWRIGGKTFYDIFDTVHGRDYYPMTYGIMSESIHGSWNDSLDFDLTANDDGTYRTFPFFQQADPRFVGPLIRFGVPPYRMWLRRIDAYDASLGNVLDWIEHVNGALFMRFDEVFDGP